MHIVSESHPERWTAFIAVIQLGTLIAVLIYFRMEIVKITANFLRENFTQRIKYREQSLDSKLGWLIIAGTIPIVIIGFGLKDVIEGVLTKNLYVISGSLIFFAVLLAISEKVADHKRNMEELTIFDSVIIGIAQACALIPGASRSGTTITGGLFVGLKRSDAARYSFLLSIPAVFASGILQLYRAIPFLNNSMILHLVLATFSAAASGYFAIDFLISYLKKHSTFIFIYYKIILGISILIALSAKFIKP